MGLSAAWALGKRGIRSVVIDPLPRRTERNGSNDESKVFRVAYRNRADYSRLALQALAGWRRLERDARTRLLLPHGLLALGRDAHSFASESEGLLRAMDREPLRLDGAAIERAHPAFKGAGFDHAVLDRDGGLLDPPAILDAMEAQARANGARILRGQRVVALERKADGWTCALDRGQVVAPRVIVAAGWSASLLLPELAPLLRTTRQPEFAFAPRDPRPFTAPTLPVFAAFEDGYYGFPMHRGAVKVADHRKGPEVAAEPARDPPTRAEEEHLRGGMAGVLPGLADAPLARSRLCFYDNTPDDDFLLGPHPGKEGLLLAVGFSGHGFKFAPAIGEALADLVDNRAVSKDWAACNPVRFLRA